MDLRNYGFVKVGRWKLNENIKSGIDFELMDFKEERVIYAFVVDGETKYIGICESSKRTLEDRMIKFKYSQGGGTNKRIADEIKKCLENGKTVEIFALKLELVVQYKGLEVDLIRGLEYPLIEKLDPEWNIMKN
ncbi:hypothetical protein CFE53_01765 [Methanofervidicoccus sp. A16]|uniref:hypothetical protein n=1 Tax=Methanofervidicoccus sp. A16 TaxID=2607662 RepID=UPI0011893174|nr:hypothetical protein [Methanofervidicoccus sp. A16]AXI24947.1 hypothetical protein CFE53_01765 [Methanofervidicoccus sp. A16]